MNVNNRWEAYKMATRLKIGEMEKDYLLNCIVFDTDRRMEGKTAGQIIRQEFSRLKRCINDRNHALQDRGERILAISLI